MSCYYNSFAKEIERLFWIHSKPSKKFKSHWQYVSRNLYNHTQGFWIHNFVSKSKGNQNVNIALDNFEEARIAKFYWGLYNDYVEKMILIRYSIGEYF